jgi:DNA polymerase (family X)
VHTTPLLRTIHDLSALARIRGDAHEQRVWSRAAELVSAYGIATDALLGPLVDRPATRPIADLPAAATSESKLDEAALRSLRHLYQTSAWVMLESAIVDLPADLRWLFESGALSIQQLARLHDASGITATADLADLIRRDVLRDFQEIDEVAHRAIVQALPGIRHSMHRIPLGRATEVAERILDVVGRHPTVSWAQAAGSMRRGLETVGDIEIVVSATAPDEVIETVLGEAAVTRCLHRSARRIYVISDGVQVGVRCPDMSAAGATLLLMTGSHAHLDHLHARAARRSWRLTPQGLDRGAAGSVVGGSEEAIYDALGLPWIPAEIRTGDDELRAAETGTLPRLLQRDDLRGDLHLHTHYSDGRDDIETMVAASIALGYEYIAITDHSPHSAASRSLTADGVRQQADEIARLRERYPQVAILHGCEVDILPDERLDFSDRVLERFDIVLASLHDPDGQSPHQLLRRYIAAMRHPLVSVITHPGNRLVPGRAAYDIDYDQLFAVAVETGTMVEVDGAPAHLDLDGALARRAVLAGAMLVVNSDSHRADVLRRQMDLGVRMARRGWVEARHVMNTRPLGALRAILKGKRSG